MTTGKWYTKHVSAVVRATYQFIENWQLSISSKELYLYSTYLNVRKYFTIILPVIQYSIKQNAKNKAKTAKEWSKIRKAMLTKHFSSGTFTPSPTHRAIEQTYYELRSWILCKVSCDGHTWEKTHLYTCDATESGLICSLWKMRSKMLLWEKVGKIDWLLTNVQTCTA